MMAETIFEHLEFNTRQAALAVNLLTFTLLIHVSYLTKCQWRINEEDSFNREVEYSSTTNVS